MDFGSLPLPLVRLVDLACDRFEAEWRGVNLMTVDGEMLDRSEVFDESDLDAALARFDELRPQTGLKNAASQAFERFRASHAARNWDAMTETMAEARTAIVAGK